MKRSEHYRIMQRRSPPRLMAIGVESLGENPPTKRVLQPKIQTPRRKSVFAVVLESIVALPAMDYIEPEKSRTTIEKEHNRKNYPHFNVQTSTDPSLRMKEEHVKKPQTPRIRRSHTRNAQTTEGKSSRALRARFTNLAQKGEVPISVGTRQTWKFTERYQPELHGEDVYVKFTGNQALRVTFHKGGGTILQDIEIVPKESGIDIGLPPSSRYMTVEGLGSLPSVFDKAEIGAGEIELRYPHGELSPVGFDASSHVQQVGLFRYLSRGMFIEAKESLSNKVSGKAITFTAGEALARVDDLRMFCSSSIRTLVVVLRTLPGANPSLQFKADGVIATSDPLVIQRENQHAFFFQITAKDDIDGPAIFDVDTDESTDVSAVVGYRAQYNQIFDYYKRRVWNRLVHSGPLSNIGKCDMSFNFGDERTIRKSKESTPPTEKLDTKTKVMEIKDVPSTEKGELPLVAELEVKATESFQLDLGRYASDEDELDTLRFELISGPDFAVLHETGWLQGTAENNDSGKHTLKVRVIDSGGLHADARFSLHVVPKVVNRAPVWKPTVRQSKSETEDQPNNRKRRR